MLCYYIDPSTLVWGRHAHGIQRRGRRAKTHIKRRGIWGVLDIREENEKHLYYIHTSRDNRINQYLCTASCSVQAGLPCIPFHPALDFELRCVPQQLLLCISHLPVGESHVSIQRTFVLICMPSLLNLLPTNSSNLPFLYLRVLRINWASHCRGGEMVAPGGGVPTAVLLRSSSQTTR